MKNVVIVVLLGCCVALGALLIRERQRAVTPVPVASAEPAPNPASAPGENSVAQKPGPAKPISANASVPEKVIAAAPAVIETKTDAATAALHEAVDDLLAAKNGAQKHELFQQLVKSGQIDAAITELKQRAADNPNDAGVPTTLGEALLNKVRAIHDAGGELNEQGILAMQADQSFNAALKIDPANYEAQLVKSISQTFWPADPARDGQVVQTLAGLIDRQESMPTQPDFAQAYLYLGNQYQKIGQPDKAQATWQIGLQKFPNDPALQKKNGGQ